MSDTLRRTVTICNVRGLHARASAKFVETGLDYQAEILVSKDGETVSADSIMELLMLAASKGSAIDIICSGPQAEPALDALVALVEAGFHEED